MKIKGNLYQILRTSYIVSPREIRDIKKLLERCKINISIKETYLLDFFKELLIKVREEDSELTKESITAIVNKLKEEYLSKILAETKDVIQSRLGEDKIEIATLQKILDKIDSIILKIDNLIKYLEDEEKSFNHLSSSRL